MTASRHLGIVLALSVLALGPVRAQSRPTNPPSADLAAALAEGWSALGGGDLAKAARAAERAMGNAPLNPAAVALAVEVDITKGGALAGLDTYERWLGARKVDAPYVLRRLAHAHLRWVARQQQPARLEAIKALVADGDEAAAAELLQGAAAGGPAQAKALASLGDPRGVEMLIGQLQVPSGSKQAVIESLGESGSRLAVPPLVNLLTDLREDHRAAAARALGRLNAADAIPHIKPLLNDPVVPVRIAAAAALYRLEDYSGVDLLESLLASEHSAVRLSAADAMASNPPSSWLAVVRALANDPDTTVQLGAARLIAPYDPQLAASVLERLRSAENPAIREEAGRAFVQQIAGDFASLRRYLRSADGLTVVRAASRILELTR